MPSDSRFSKDDAYRILELINSWINNVDTKISFALAYAAVLIGVVFYSAGTVPAAIQIYLDADQRYFGMIFSMMLVICLYISSLLSIIMLLRAMIGRTKNISGKSSMLFFGTIAKMKMSDYQSEIMGMDDEALIKDLTEQIHTNAIICSKKFKYYNYGICFLLAATILCFVCMVFQLI